MTGYWKLQGREAGGKCWQFFPSALRFSDGLFKYFPLFFVGTFGAVCLIHRGTGRAQACGAAP